MIAPIGSDGSDGTWTGNNEVAVGSGVGSSFKTLSMVPPTTSGDEDGLPVGCGCGEDDGPCPG